MLLSRTASIVGALVMVLASGARAAPPADATETALDKCLATDDGASTGGQTACIDVALRAYDQRLNLAYQGLLKTLPAAPAQRLRQSQRAWVAFRDSERAAQDALFATTEGTMFVPMQAHAAMSLTRDRALRLESYLWIVRDER